MFLSDLCDCGSNRAVGRRVRCPFFVARQPKRKHTGAKQAGGEDGARRKRGASLATCPVGFLGVTPTVFLLSSAASPPLSSPLRVLSWHTHETPLDSRVYMHMKEGHVLNETTRRGWEQVAVRA
jgi:hypothetical protein